MRRALLLLAPATLSLVAVAAAADPVPSLDLRGFHAPTDPASAAFATYYGNYHGTYEPPFCHAQAKALFDTVR